MENQEILRIHYAIPAVNRTFMVIVSLAIPAVFFYWALTNHNWLSLLGVVRLSPHSASIFYCVWAVISFLAASVAVFSAFARGEGPGYIEMRPDSLFVPRASLSGKMFVIPYQAIRSIRCVDVHNTRFLIIQSAVGESRLMAAGFLSEAEFANFHRHVQGRIG